MEFIKGECLYDFMGSKPPKQIVHQVICSLAEALQKLHGCGIIHNDLHMGNIMVYFQGGSWVVRLIDLGLAKFKGQAPYPYLNETEIKGTHLDPSLANGGPCSSSTDMYSFGKILTEMYKLTKCFTYFKISMQLCTKRNLVFDIYQLMAQNCPECSSKLENAEELLTEEESDDDNDDPQQSENLHD